MQGDPDRDQNRITCLIYHPKPLHKNSLWSIHNVLSNVADNQTDRQTKQRYQKHNLFAEKKKSACYSFSRSKRIIISGSNENLAVANSDLFELLFQGHDLQQHSINFTDALVLTD